mmetsp:Transcript_14041/g.39758  ORF Transcript_14041/g.39758 Transcript_14041/m.39758 type:complete len:256 (-) Transcript_14041:41-808(-)
MHAAAPGSGPLGAAPCGADVLLLVGADPGVGEEGLRVRSLPSFLLEAKQQKILHVRADALRKRRMHVLHDSEEGAHRLQLVVGRVAGEELHNQAAHGPHIAAGRDLRHLDHLRRHPVGGANHVLHLLPRCLEVGGHAKIRQLHEPLGGGEDVGSLDVAVHHSLLVQVHQPLQHLGNVHGGQRLRENTKLVGLERAGQVAVLHELKDDVKVRPRLEGVQVLHNVLMVQALQQIDLTHHVVQVLCCTACELHLLDGH